MAGKGLNYAGQGLSFEQLFSLAVQVKLGADASNEQIVDLLYSNVFGFLPDARQKAPYLAMLDTQLSLRCNWE